MAGLLIEAVTHRSVAAAIRADLTGPAGLTRTTVQDAERPAPPLTVPRHEDVSTTSDGYLPMRSFASAFVTAGGMAADAADVARWGYLLYGGRLLEPGLVAQMTEPLATDTGTPGTPYTAYGLGTMQFGLQLGPDSLGHTGQSPGFSSLLVVVPERHVAVAVLIVGDSVDVIGPTRAVIAALGT